MRFTLRQLEVFLATARLGNLSQAAEALSLSQSAASESLKTLEQQFDIQLFDRTGKKLRLNDLGTVLRPKAQALLDRAIDLELDLQHHQDAGGLNLGATMSIGNYNAIPYLARFADLYPEISPTLEIANTKRISEKLINFELDVGLIEGEINHPELIIEPWQDDELILVCGAEHLLADAGLHQRGDLPPILSDDELRDEQWILREQGSGTRQTFDRAMAGLLPQLHVRMELQHIEAIKQAVAAGLGISCLSRLSVQEMLDSGRLIELKAANRNFSRQLFLVWHKKKFLSAAMTAWIDLCRESA
ncbi:MAG: LysR family transcriptional regulator [unclassified Hahellaceae]|nr:LysR family transcriptional regulator [Hahellaceae bacterium]|tara:strand:+ start:9634 stop:10542 length:909 start_codon:yes stop_codon:yes gene_type:complete